MKRKNFKKAGAAVLAMAMLLSVGAASALTASAAPDTSTYSVTIKDVSKNAYKYSKIASLDEDGVTYTVENSWTSWLEVDANNYLCLKAGYEVNGKSKLADLTAASDAQALAAALAAKGVVGTPINETDGDKVTGLTPGYYLFSSANANAQPMLIEVTNDINQGLTAKVTDVSITKTIYSIEDSTTTTAANDLIMDAGKTGLVSKGAKVTFELDTSIPSYDIALLRSRANITDFVVTDIPEDTLTGLTVKSVTVGDATTTEDTDYTVETASKGQLKADATKSYFDENTDDTAGTGVKITFKDEYVLTHGGQPVVIMLEATVADTVDLNADANTNTATVEYHNNYFTGGSQWKDPDPNHPDDPPTPDEPENPNDEDQDSASVYATLVTVNKFDQDGTALAGAEFSLYKGTDTTANPIAVLGTREDLSVFSFEGLNVGTYTLVETKVPSPEYKAAAAVTFTVSSNTAGTYTFTNTTRDNEIDVTNIKGQTLPATGGIGTILFTVGGAAIVMLAGVLFVVYMKKRKVEE